MSLYQIKPELDELHSSVSIHGLVCLHVKASLIQQRVCVSYMMHGLSQSRRWSKRMACSAAMKHLADHCEYLVSARSHGSSGPVCLLYVPELTEVELQLMNYSYFDPFLLVHGREQ